MDDGKYYSSRSLRNVKDIVNYVPPPESVEQEKEFNQQQQKRKVNRVLRKEGLDETNIITTTRTRKPKQIYDV